MSKLIMLEGPRACGKSTIAKLLVDKGYHLADNHTEYYDWSENFKYAIGEYLAYSRLQDLGVDIVTDRGVLSVCNYSSLPVDNMWYYILLIRQMANWKSAKLVFIIPSKKELLRRRNLRGTKSKDYSYLDINYEYQWYTDVASRVPDNAKMVFGNESIEEIIAKITS